MKIYVVYGQCGEYSDHRDWLVCAYADRDKAEKHAFEAEKRSKEMLTEYEHWMDIPDGANKYDTQMDMDYTGASYLAIEVEVLEELP